ncbi:MAG TPA: hypothetical protein VFS62_17695 [Chloroflexota bacterium]|nr:hypothetical protein [Chloroflexota bacterium]
MHRNWAPLASYLAVEILLLVMLRLTPANGVWFLLAGFLAIGFVGAIVFREHPVDNSKALILSSGIVFALLWAYIFGTLLVATAADPGIIPPAVKDALQHNLAANLFGAVLDALAAMCTSWMVCVLLAIVGNTFGAKVRRLVVRP